MTTEAEIKQRLDAVRASMANQGLDAYIVPRADEYLGEYVPDQNERLRWISGFTGSAGAVIVLKDSAVIFIDGRYTIQVRQQAPAALFQYEHLVENPPVRWLADQLNAGAKVGYDPRTHTYAWKGSAEKVLEDAGISLTPVTDNLIDLNWADRPQPESLQVLLLDEAFTGESSEAKRTRIGQDIAKAGADAALISQLDSIAWLLNIRGHDVSRLPVLLGFAMLSADGEMRLFTDLRKLPNDISDHVGEGVSFQAETQLAEALSALGAEGAKVLADPDTANAWCQMQVENAGGQLVSAADPVLLPKAQKNPVELGGIRQSHIRDGAAVSRFLAWIDSEVAAGRLHDEAELADQLEAFRRELLNIQDLSFDTISAAGSNAAMAHYNHLNGTPAQLELNNLYLVDSGGQYLDGTTDITRTIIIGEPSEEHREHFTLVLKGNIALSRCRFPKGTSGVQLDVLARQFLWSEGLNFDHGTGHGVGCFLSVHEGPQRISPKGSDTALLPGMVLSNEPGYYKENAYGIRCENLMAVVECPTETEYEMLQFEVVTFAPFDLRLVDTSLMTADEIAWLNDYHQAVYSKVAPHLEGDDLAWLEQATKAI